MRKQHVHIFGASGSGTTTIAPRISKQFGFAHFDTDDYFWLHGETFYRGAQAAGMSAAFTRGFGCAQQMGARRLPEWLGECAHSLF